MKRLVVQEISVDSPDGFPVLYIRGDNPNGNQFSIATPIRALFSRRALWDTPDLETALARLLVGNHNLLTGEDGGETLDDLFEMKVAHKRELQRFFDSAYSE